MNPWLIGLTTWALIQLPAGCLIGRILAGPKNGERQ